MKKHRELDWLELSKVIKWISLIDFCEWPQQSDCPAMAHGHWHGLQEVTQSLVDAEMRHWLGCKDFNRMLSVVMPGRNIEPHRDDPQPLDWITRIHIPLTTNPEALFYFEGQPSCPEVGWSYLLDVTREHAIENKGSIPRIHFMFDITAP